GSGNTLQYRLGMIAGIIKQGVIIKGIVPGALVVKFRYLSQYLAWRTPAVLCAGQQFRCTIGAPERTAGRGKERCKRGISVNIKPVIGDIVPLFFELEAKSREGKVKAFSDRPPEDKISAGGFYSMLMIERRINAPENYRHISCQLPYHLRRLLHTGIPVTHN